MNPDAVRVFVPGHVTGFFSVHRDPDPRVAGSRGAGITLADGVEVIVQRTGDAGLYVDDTAMTMEPVETVLEQLEVSPAIHARTAVPLGAGFGVSGAITLGTAIGVNALYACNRTENELGTIAHAAEVAAATGLGDVVAQLRGGVPIRRAPGAPTIGQLDGIPIGGRIEYLSFGERSTEDIIGGDTTAINLAGEAALEGLLAEPTLDSLFEQSRRFSRSAGLLTSATETAIDRVGAVGGEAAMAMIGNTVFARDTGLSDAGYDPSRCQIATRGVRIDAGCGRFS